MGVLKKRRRKICCLGRTFYWYIRIGEDDNYYYLNIISEDKLFIVSYQLSQSLIRDNPIIIVKGREFRDRKLDGCWHHVLCPKWMDIVITPSFVAEIIRWCFETEGFFEESWMGEIKQII